jgi:hypothetical protein
MTPFRPLPAPVLLPAVAPKRTTGTNAPGGSWHATPNTRRKRPAIPVTMLPEAWTLADQLADGGGRGQLITRLLVAEARRRGVEVPPVLAAEVDLPEASEGT